jgi:uncharacterized membrane protein YjfL (UPF0719 family)
MIAAIFLSIVQLLLAIVLSALAAYLGVWVFNRSTPGLDEWAELRKGNPAVGVDGAVIVGVGHPAPGAAGCDAPTDAGATR